MVKQQWLEFSHAGYRILIGVDNSVENGHSVPAASNRVQIVREGNSGILYLSSSAKDQPSVTGDEKLFVPNYDMDAAIELLRQFQELKQFNGCPLTTSYKVGRYNWYPAMVSYLFWYVFFPYIKYQPLISSYLTAQRRFLWNKEGTFRSLITLLKARGEANFKTRLHYWLVKWNNRLVTRRHRADLLYFSFGRNDFRAKEIRETLTQLGSRFIKIVPRTSFRNMIQNIVGGGKDYYYGRESRSNRFRYNYDLTGLAREKQKLFEAAVRIVETSITGYLIEYEDHLKALKKCDAHTFYGLDDINGYIFPLLYACRTKGMRTIGHQHGAYVRRHAGYIMPGIHREEFTWFDNVIVWGKYWKEKLLKESELYSPDFFIVGANKFRKNYPVSQARTASPINILIPYEFLTNTFKVGQYIQKLMDLGYNIFFKPRPDEAIADQLDAYCLPTTYRDQLTIVADLDEATLRKIDIVAGTMTTLIYELLPCDKIIWILETEYRHLDDLVEEGLAHKVREEDLGNLDESFFTRTCFPAEKLFGSEPLSDTLRKHVVSPVIDPD